jgi:hypothetical protein
VLHFEFRFVQPDDSYFLQKACVPGIYNGKPDTPATSQLRRKIDGCDVFGECHRSHTGKKNFRSDQADIPKKGKGAVTPTYIGSSNPITNPDSTALNRKVRCAARAAGNHGDIIRYPPADTEDMRRSKNDYASQEIRRKHSNGDIITGNNQAFTNCGKGRYLCLALHLRYRLL